MNVPGLLSLSNPISDVLQYIRVGWYPTPLCWPVSDECGCGRQHEGRNVGKAPVFGYGYQNTLFDLPLAEDYWKRYPRANVGILLEPSQLVVIDLDGKDAIFEARQKGLPHTATVETGKGLHMYYRRPQDFPLGRAVQKGETKAIDILSRGYVVAPPSLHRRGALYTWNIAPESLEKLPYPPWWTRQFFPKHRPSWMQRRGASSTLKHHFEPNHATPETVRAALAHLDASDYQAWLQIGFALQMWDDSGNGSGKGFELWDDWSRADAKYPGSKELRKKWKSFRKNNGGVSLGTLFAFAKKSGWSPTDRTQMPTANKKGSWFR